MQHSSLISSSSSNRVSSLPAAESSTTDSTTSFPSMIRIENTANSPDSLATPANHAVSDVEASLFAEMKQFSQLQNIMETAVKKEQWMSFDGRMLFGRQFERCKSGSYAEAYYNAQLLLSALTARTAWIHAKVRVVNLIQQANLPDSNQSQFSLSLLERQVLSMIDSALVHQKTVEILQSDQKNQLPNDIETQDLSDKKRAQARKKLTLAQQRYAELMSNPRLHLTEDLINQKLNEYLCSNEVIQLINSRFPALPADVIQKIIRGALAKLILHAQNSHPGASLLETKFKCDRMAVPEEFWEGLEQGIPKLEFNQAFFQFIFTSWKSDKTVMLAMDRDLDKARQSDNIDLQCKLLTEKRFRQGMYESARRIIQSILDYAKDGQRLQDTEILSQYQQEKIRERLAEYTLQINTLYNDAFEKLYSTYLDRKNKNWNEVDLHTKDALLQQYKEALQSHKKLTSRKIYIGRKDALSTRQRLLLVNQALEQLRQSEAISVEQLTDLMEDIFKHPSSTLQEAQETSQRPAKRGRYMRLDLENEAMRTSDSDTESTFIPHKMMTNEYLSFDMIDQLLETMVKDDNQGR